jgi:hypothetical protein
MGINVTLNFNASPPPAGKTFKELRVVLTDAGGSVRTVAFTQAQIQTAAEVQPDGSYNLPVAFPTVAVGPYTVTATAVDMLQQPFGPTVSSSGTVPLADGVWVPAPASFV